MDNYSLSYFETAINDYGAAMQPAFDAATDYVVQTIRAFNSVGDNTNIDKLNFINQPHQQCFIDYVLHEQMVDGVYAYDNFLAANADSEAAKYINKFKSAFDKSHTSLFRVVDVDVEEGYIYFDDILNDGKEYAIIDNVLANSYSLNNINYNYLTFFRFVPFLGDFLDLNNHEEEGITTGMSTAYMFFFEPNMEIRIQKELKRLYPLIKAQKESSKRQIAFAELHKAIGRKLILQ